MTNTAPITPVARTANVEFQGEFYHRLAHDRWGGFRPATRTVAVHLANESLGRGRPSVTFTIPTLAHGTGLAGRTVRRALHQLRDAGVIACRYSGKDTTAEVSKDWWPGAPGSRKTRRVRRTAGERANALRGRPTSAKIQRAQGVVGEVGPFGPIYTKSLRDTYPKDSKLKTTTTNQSPKPATVGGRGDSSEEGRESGVETNPTDLGNLAAPPGGPSSVVWRRGGGGAANGFAGRSGWWPPRRRAPRASLWLKKSLIARTPDVVSARIPRAR